MSEGQKPMPDSKVKELSDMPWKQREESRTWQKERVIQELRSQGKTIIVSTHIFSLVEKLCDRVGILINGRMVCCDTLDQIRQGESLEDRFFTIYQETVGDGE